MSNVIVIIPVTKDFKKSNLEVFLLILSRAKHINFCFSYSSKSKYINELKCLETSFPNIVSLISSEQKNNFSSLAHVAHTACLKDNRFSYYGTLCMIDTLSMESFEKQIEAIDNNMNSSVFFGANYKYGCVKKRFFVKLLNIYAKYYLNFDLSDYSLKNVLISREFASELYEKPIPLNFFYEFFFIKRFSNYIYSNLEPINNLN